MRSSPWLLLVTACLLACKREPPPPAPPPRAAPSAPSSSVPVAARPSASATPPGLPPLVHLPPTPPDKTPHRAGPEIIDAYFRALRNGRQATTDQRFADALASFDRGLRLMPDDARMLSERGHARLASGDAGAAAADLARATTLTHDRALLGEALLRYGLAAERAGEAEGARAAFVRAHALTPTAETKAKVAGASACPAVVGPRKPWSRALTFATFQAAYASAAAAYDGLAPWTDEATARRTLCAQPSTKGQACVALLGDVATHELRVYVPSADGTVVGLELERVSGRCGSAIAPTLVADDGGVAHVAFRTEVGVPLFVSRKHGKDAPCTERDPECTTACGAPTIAYADVFIAKAKGAQALYVGRAAEGGADPLRLSVALPKVSIAGRGCDGTRVIEP